MTPTFVSHAPTKIAKPKAEPKGPSVQSQRREVAQVLLDAGAKIVETWNPKAHNGISREVAYDAIRQCLAYTPHGTTWPTALGVRDIGRPVPAKKS